MLHTLQHVQNAHGPEVFLLPLSAASGGGGIFQVSRPETGTVVGLQIAPTNRPRTKTGKVSDLTTLELDQIVIDKEKMRICAGAAITLEQLNQALANEVGPHFKVLGADLTSYTYAQVGATFMTGGMGPQRRYFSDSVTHIALCNGGSLQTISGEDLLAYGGTYGWTGLVSAVCCQYHRLPEHEIAFAIPISNTPERLSKLIATLSKYCYLELDHDKVVTITGKTDLITGIEHVTAESMEPMLAKGSDTALTHRTEILKTKCISADVDGLVFIHGHSDLPLDEFLVKLIDDETADTPTIGGVNLEHTEVFKDAEQMRAIREAIPFAARTQAPRGRFVFKDHTDATIRLHPDRVESALTALWKLNLDYVERVRNFFDREPCVSGQILLYGHMNPYGIDPHNRITMACDDETFFDRATAFLNQQRQAFYLALRDLCDDTSSIFVGGEKGACSESDILLALSRSRNVPELLEKKFHKQHEKVSTTDRIFAWRALPPYCYR